jgi:hypothetical protein
MSITVLKQRKYLPPHKYDEQWNYQITDPFYDSGIVIKEILDQMGE